jgi:hypothetical protein
VVTASEIPSCSKSTAATKVRARLSCDVRELLAFVSSPKHPVNAAIPDNLASILVMVRASIPFGSAIRDELRCRYARKPFEKSRSFATRLR